MPLFDIFWKKDENEESSGDEVEDKSADDLSHVGEAAYNVLRREHNHHHHELWNVTKAKIVGDIQFTPRDAFTRSERTDPDEGHDDWFPKKIADVLRRTKSWCDVLSLAPPDGAFMTEFKSALRHIVENHKSGEKVVIRMMFGNLPLMPLDCNKLIQEFTKNLPPNAPNVLHLWVGSWRKDVSWNHAKIVAVDGKYLWTGGHNFWDKHYLRSKPVNDLSLEMEGGVATDAHRFANAQWGYIVKKQDTAWGRFIDQNVSDAIEVPRRARVTVSDYPSSAADFPPFYKPKKQVGGKGSFDPEYVPVITMGRYGQLLKKARPSDDAFAAMLGSAQRVIRLALQDLGPVALPGTKNPLPGLSWPHKYLDQVAKVIWERRVDIEIILSNPASIPGDLSATEACYGNGWSCVDVAAEIIKAITSQYPEARDQPGKLRTIVEENLRVCFLKSPLGGRYKDGNTLGLHAKHFIIDDVCCYIGSQNLYVCDLAEWGVVIDNPKAVESIKKQYWDPMWAVSYKVDDCEVDEVINGLNVNREAQSQDEMTAQQREQAKVRLQYQGKIALGDGDSDDEEMSDQED